MTELQEFLLWTLPSLVIAAWMGGGWLREIIRHDVTAQKLKNWEQTWGGELD